MTGHNYRGGDQKGAGHDWHLTASGLYLPNSQNGDDASSLVYNKWQAWGTVAAACVAVAALIVSLVTAIPQFSANSLAQENEQSEYASKVAWWLEGDTVKVQNRSVVPIRDLSLSYQVQKQVVLGPVIATTSEGLLRIGLTRVFASDSLQPCAVLTLSAKDLLDRLDSTPGYKVIGDGEPRLGDGSLIFADAHGNWSVKAGGAPTPLSDGDRATLEAEQQQAISRPSDAGRNAQSQISPAPDCGS